MSAAGTLPGFDELYRRADRQRLGATVAVAGSADPTVREALHFAAQRGWIQRPLQEDQTPSAAVAQVQGGTAPLLMKGLVATPDLLKAVLDPASGLRTDRVIGQLVLMEIVPAARRFLMIDTGICIQPTLDQKADLLRSAVDAARRLGCARPRVAVMAATEKVTTAMPETQDAAELEARSRAGEFGDCVVQGPLSFDLAYARDAGDKKSLAGEVVGAADIMLFPNLAAANLTVKAIMYTADCRFGGVLVGVRYPVVFMSRADNTATRLNSLALAMQLMS
jgi:phosphotransacetylase